MREFLTILSLTFVATYDILLLQLNYETVNLQQLDKKDGGRK